MKKPTTQFQQIPNSFLRNTSNLSGAAVKVMLSLSSYDPCHPSYECLLKDTGLSKASVSSALKELIQTGFVVSYKKGNNRKKLANLYSLTWTPAPLVQKVNSIPTSNAVSTSLKIELNQSPQVEYIAPKSSLVQKVNSNNSNIIYNNTLESKNQTQYVDDGKSLPLTDLNGPTVTDSNNSKGTLQDKHNPETELAARTQIGVSQESEINFRVVKFKSLIETKAPKLLSLWPATHHSFGYPVNDFVESDLKLLPEIAIDFHNAGFDSNFVTNNDLMFSLGFGFRASHISTLITHINAYKPEAIEIEPSIHITPKRTALQRPPPFQIRRQQTN